jgi:hypothetical protein
LPQGKKKAPANTRVSAAAGGGKPTNVKVPGAKVPAAPPRVLETFQ